MRTKDAIIGGLWGLCFSLWLLFAMFMVAFTVVDINNKITAIEPASHLKLEFGRKP